MKRLGGGKNETFPTLLHPILLAPNTSGTASRLHAVAATRGDSKRV